MNKFFTVFTVFFLTVTAFSQQNLSTLLISADLKEKANSVIRDQKIDIVIESQKLYRAKKRKVVTVFNEYGLKNIDAREYYSQSERIISVQAIIFDSFGKEIKKIRRKDFNDQSVVDGFSILSDNRVLYLDYTPTEYPFTILYESEIESINTALLPSWFVIDDYYESIQKSEFSIKYPDELGFKYKQSNFEGFDITKTEEKNLLRFSVENISAKKPENYSPSFNKIVPNVVFALEKFSLEGVEGVANSWKEFGKGYYDDLINVNTELEPQTIEKINLLTQGEDDPLEKAKIIYEYVQSRTRYVSIQLGIGGWKPMLAKDVDRLGYGDCKALTNYTRMLLENVGVKSYYTVIYGDSDKRDLDKDFVSYQGNHVILTIPHNGKNYFLECTSQINPFAFCGDFTDDRYALMIKPEGGVIIKTNEYTAIDSYQKIVGNYSVDKNGDLYAEVEVKSGGIQYDQKAYLSRLTDESELHKAYKNKINWVSNLKIENLELKNNRESIEFLEKLSFSANNYCNKAGNSIYFILNVFNKNEHIPKKYRNRENEFEIIRGYYDLDEVEIQIPEEYKIDFIPENINLETEFGSYKMHIKVIDEIKLFYKRSLLIKKGKFTKVQYEEYRKFRENVVKNDNLKLVLIQK